MQKYYRIPLLFFFLAAGFGLFLRWQFVVPTPGVRYTFFLHAHSHLMFLGWVFNVLYLSFIEHNLPEKGRKNYLIFFLALQPLVIAMMISFPIQGYGVFSIIFSTVHTLAVMAFIPVFFRNTRHDRRVSTWFARAALIFFFISTAGPFSLGYLMSNDLGQTVWYNFSIYYYLHFQYNGFFLFGVISLFFQLLEKKKITFSSEHALKFGKWMAAACVPAYALSILFAKPGIAYNIMGALAAIAQLAALGIFVRLLGSIRTIMSQRFSALAAKIFQLVMMALILKSILQLVSAQPEIAEFAYSVRPVVIAYLHLVLIGVITLFLLAWYYERNLVNKRGARWAIALLLSGFATSEACLALIPWWSAVVGKGIDSSVIIFLVSILMLAGALVFYLAFKSLPASVEALELGNGKTDKNQFFR
ncbi:MAG: hypothetical protein M3Y60_09945 [Bacteroidota bacterium]|nr:hypothetical protein [Bacteroidota bacterium]